MPWIYLLPTGIFLGSIAILIPVWVWALFQEFRK